VQTGGEVVTVPSVGMGLVLVRTSDNRVAAFESGTGKRRWTFQRQNPPLVLRQTGQIAMDAGNAYVGLPGGRLVALSLDTGALRWEAAVAMPRGSNEIERIADVVGSPLISGSDICAVTFQGRVGCFDMASGRTLWARDLSSPTGLDLDGRLLVVPDDRGEVHAFARGGASVWRQDKLRQRTLSAPLLLERRVLLGDNVGLVHGLSRDDGALDARIATDGSSIVAAPVKAGDLAVVQTGAGALYALKVQ
jgi:outer membrane protein assembly factor BamB